MSDGETIFTGRFEIGEAGVFPTPLFITAVRDMRRLQKAWFGGDKSRETLNSAKAAERRVDKLLAEIDAPPPVQPDLFGGK